MLVQNYVGGRWLSPPTPRTLPVTNPATGEVIARTPMSGPAEVGDAVAAASQAFPAWRATPSVERARVLFRLVGMLAEHHEELARSLTVEHGKTLRETRAELRRGIENIEHACGIPTLLLGDSLEDIGRGVDCVTMRQPLGVFAIVTPYNFPIMIPLWFWPYAVAAGNSVVLKPSEQDPITHQRVVELAEEAGLPPGVLNVVHGGRESVDALCDHPDVAGVSFVGSSSVAKSVYARAAASGKRVQALGGAKNHLVVLPDADLAASADACVSSIFGSTGQRCLAGSIVVGVGEAYGPIREGILERAAALQLGDGLDEKADMGPVISADHKDRVRRFIDVGEREGARVTLDGREATVDGLPDGHWIGPTIFEGVDPGTELGREEIFGPVAGVTRARDLDEAVLKMQRSHYGNACSIFTTSGKSARDFRYRSGISMIGVNIGVAAPMACFPFGGSKGSFYGDLKAQGRDAVSFFTDQRVVISRW